MTTLLDLLANEDRGSLATKPRPTGPFICRWCGHEEPNQFLLSTNHAPDCFRARRDHACTSMDLTRAHVTSSARTLHMRGDFLPCCWTGQKHKFNTEHALGTVRSMVDRAAEIWPAERLTWLRTALTAEHLPEDLVDELTWRAA